MTRKRVRSGWPLDARNASLRPTMLCPAPNTPATSASLRRAAHARTRELADMTRLQTPRRVPP
eukprot:507894-Rhodomonas_salina.1